MGCIKKMIAFIVTLTLVICMAANTYAASFLDTNGHWAQWTIENLASQGIISGYDGMFRPDDSITRAEFFSIINNAYGFWQEADISFNDVRGDEWYASQIKKAVAAGYLTGYEDNTARPTANITRNEVSVVVSKLSNLPASPGASDKFTDAGSIPEWAKQYVDAITGSGFMSGYPDGSFGPGKKETRAEAAVLVAKAREYSKVWQGKGTTEGIVDGDLTIDKSYGPEYGKTVINGNVTITANGLTLKNVTIKGDLTIDASSGNGAINLNNVKVEGSIYIINGKSVYMSGSAINVSYNVASGYFSLTSGQIGTLTVTKDAEGSKINVDKGAVIDYAVINAKCALTGKGQITKAMINVAGVTAESGLIKSYDTGSRSAQIVSSGNGSTGGYSGGVYVPPYVPTNPTDPGTQTAVITSISVNTSPKTSYIEDDLLDLTGLSVMLHKSNGTSEAVDFSDFAAKGISVNPVNGTKLTTAETSVKITHTASGKAVSLAITVVAKSTPVAPLYVEVVSITEAGLPNSYIVTVKVKSNKLIEVASVDKIFGNAAIPSGTAGEYYAYYGAEAKPTTDQALAAITLTLRSETKIIDDSNSAIIDVLENMMALIKVDTAKYGNPVSITAGGVPLTFKSYYESKYQADLPGVKVGDTVEVIVVCPLHYEIITFTAQ